MNKKLSRALDVFLMLLTFVGVVGGFVSMFVGVWTDGPTGARLFITGVLALVVGGIACASLKADE